MITLEKTTNIEDVYQNLLADHTDEDEDTLLPTNEAYVKCIGYRNGELLFCFNSLHKGKEVTNIGYHFIASNLTQVLYKHHTKLDILVGSVNEEKTLLVYAKKKESARSSTSFTSHLVELVNMKFFDLDIETSHIQYLIFLPWKNAKERGNRKEHLLFYLEKRSLGLIHVTTCEKDNNVEVQHIQKEILVQHYVWYQLDLESMRLYYIYLSVVKGDTANSGPRFNVLQFSPRHNPDLILSVELPLPLTPDLYTRSTKRYMTGPLSTSLPDSKVSIAVLQTDTDSLALCIALPDSYHVYILHSGLLVECKRGDKVAANVPLLFFNLHNYVFVYSPSVLLHAIDASPTHSSKYNMVFEEVPGAGALDDVDGLVQEGGKIMKLCALKLLDNGIGIMLNNTTLYKVTVEPLHLLHLYKSTECTVTWLFLLHVTLCHLHHINAAHKMVLHSIITLPNVQILDVFKEYIMSAAYLKLSQQDIHVTILSAVPFVEENSKLLALKRNRVMKLSNVYQQVTKPIISIPKGSIISEAGPFIRFNLEDFVAKCGSLLVSGGGREGSSPSGTGSTRCVSCSTQTSKSSASSTESTHSSTLTCNEEDETLVSTLHTALVLHLRRRFNDHVSLNTCNNTATSYFTLLVNQVSVLVSLILISANKTPDWNPAKEELRSATEPGLAGLYKLFNVVKFVLLQIGCPVPHNFEWIHVYTGFKTLSREIFARQIQNKSIRLTPTIVQMFLTTFSEDTSKETQRLCSLLISSLTQRQAQQVLSSWNCPAGRRFCIQYKLVGMKNKIGLSTPAQPTSDTPTYLRLHPFIPVNSFYSYVFHKMSERATPDNRVLQYCSEYSMEELRAQQTDQTLRNVHF